MKRRSFVGLIIGAGGAASLAGIASTADGAEEVGGTQPAHSRQSSTSAVSKSVLDERFGPVVDTHMHVIHAIPDPKPIPEEVREVFASAPEKRAVAIERQMDEGKVRMAFAMGQLKEANTELNDPLGIQSSLRVAARIPGRLRVVGVVDPRESGPEHMKRVERQLDGSRGVIVALKAYLGYVHAYPNDPGYLPYYKLAEKYHVPVIFHTGDTWRTKAKLKFARPEHVDDVAADYPGVNFVIAHFGNPWPMDAAEVIFKNDNVWADLSGLYVADEKSTDELLKSGSLPDRTWGFTPAAFKDAFEYASRYDRMLYGSDWPLAPMRPYRRLIEALVPAGHHEEVFRTNAERLFKIT